MGNGASSSPVGAPVDANGDESSKSTSHTWSLCIPTRDRRATLAVCVEVAAAQDPPPREVIVVDSSPAECQSHDLFEDLSTRFPHIVWRYETFGVGSLTQQRQRSIALATSDIVFTLDDDTILYPGAARSVMEIYDTDADARIAGVEMTEWLGPPVGVEVDDSADPFEISKLVHPQRSSRLRRKLGAAIRRILNFDPRWNFVPYDAEYPRHPLPESTNSLDVYPVDLMLGYRMTYRRDAISDLELVAEFKGYTPVEDFDLSYRASRRGALACSQLAGVYHHRSRSGRLTRRQLEAKSLTNLAFLLRRHCTDQRRGRRRYLLRSAHRAVANAVRDLGTARWALPTCFGCLSGSRDGWRILRADEANYARVYEELQEKF